MHDCIVVGAGLAGLVAADALQRRNRSVLVVEARDEVGGRIRNLKTASGTTVEMGGQWLSQGHDRMYELLERFQLELVDEPSGEGLVRWSDGVSRVAAAEGGAGAKLSPFDVADLGQGVQRFRRLAVRRRENPVWTEANAVWFSQSLHSWIHANLRTPAGRAAFGESLGSIGVEVPEADLASALDVVVADRGLETATTRGADMVQDRVSGGIWRLCERLAATIADADAEAIRCSSQVMAVQQRHDQVAVRCADGAEHLARNVLITLPPRLACELDYAPVLEPWREEAVSAVSVGNVIKASAEFESPWWREQGLSGQVSFDTGAVRVLSDTSPAVGAGVLTGYFAGPDASGLGERSITIRQRVFFEAVRAAFGDAPEPTDYVEVDWSAERFTGGCLGAHFTPGAWVKSASSLGAAHGRVRFAGAEYSDRFNGFMEGAVRSARSQVATLVRQG